MSNVVARVHSLLSGTGSEPTTNAVITISSANTPIKDNLLIVSTYNNANDLMSITDSASGTWTSAIGGDLIYNGSTRRMNVWYKLAAGTETSVTVSASAGSLSALYSEWSNVSANVDQATSNSLTSNATTIGTNSITTVNAYDFVYVVASVPGNQTGAKTWSGTGITINSGTYLQNEPSSGAQIWDAYGLSTATGTFSGTATYPTTGESGAIIVAFQSFNRVKNANSTSISDTYTTNGTYYWTPPTGTTVSQVQLWGGGGGGASGNAGGGGGGFAQSILPVTSTAYGSSTGGTPIAIVVGAGGAGGTGSINTSTSGSAGSNSTFNSTTVIAVGGGAGTATGGAGGSGSTGAIVGTGGAGGLAYSGGGNGGGGGGSAGINGTAGVVGTATAAITGNTGSAGTSGGGGAGATAVTNGGPGGAGGTGTGSGQFPASGPGGGGGGGGQTTNIHTGTIYETGGTGYSGQAIITYPIDSSNFIPPALGLAMLSDYQNRQRWELCYDQPTSDIFEMREEYLGLLEPFITWQKKEKINLKNQKGLSAGCGSGTNTLFLAKKGLDMIGIDYSKKAIARAFKLAGSTTFANKVGYKVHDLTRALPIKPNSIDYVFDLFTASSIKGELNRRAALINMVKVLKKGGYLISFQFFAQYESMAKEIKDHPGDETGSTFVSGSGPQIKVFTTKELLDFYQQKLTKVILAPQYIRPESGVANREPVYLFGIFRK